MPSFDIVSEVDKHQLTNSIDQARRIITNRFDFKGVDASYELDGFVIEIIAEAEFQVQQMLDSLQGILLKNSIDLKSLDIGEIVMSGKYAKLQVSVKNGLDQPLAKQINKFLKDAKIKVQSQIQGDQIRVSGKKRDDLQQAIKQLKAEEFSLPLQFINFRD